MRYSRQKKGDKVVFVPVFLADALIAVLVDLMKVIEQGDEDVVDSGEEVDEHLEVVGRKVVVGDIGLVVLEWPTVRGEIWLVVLD
jgi:hypothetical protein